MRTNDNLRSVIYDRDYDVDKLRGISYKDKYDQVTAQLYSLSHHNSIFQSMNLDLKKEVERLKTELANLDKDKKLSWYKTIFK